MKKDEPIILERPKNPLAALFAQLHDELGGELWERHAEIHACLLALVSLTNIVFIGEPGAAKTYLIDRLIMRIRELNHYKAQFNSLTGLDEVFGPLDIPTFRSTGAYVRRNNGYLPWAQVATLDEIFNGSESCLRALHAAVLEHKHSVDGAWVDMPLRVVFGLSNDMPTTSSLRAFVDRFPQVLWTSEIIEPDNLVAMLQFDAPVEVEPILSWADIEKAHEESQLLPFPREVDELIAKIKRELARDKNIEVTDRRLKLVRSIVRAEAWLEGADSVNPEHLGVLVNCLPKTKDQVEIVEEVVLNHCNPLQKEILTLLKDLSEIAAIARKAEDETAQDRRTAGGKEAYVKMQKAHKTYQALLEQVGTGRRQLAQLNKFKDQAHTISVSLLSILDLPASGAVAV